MARTYNRMILNRIRPVLYPLLRPNQNGCKHKRSTVDQILAIRRIMEGITNTNLLAVLTFIVFKQELYSIHICKMARVLGSYGIYDKVVNIINVSYVNRRYTYIYLQE